MFERFTDRARRVLVLAQDEARQLNHNFIGTEHILLGLVREEEGVAAVALTQLGITLAMAQAKIVETIGPAGTPLRDSPPFTPRAKKVLELSLRDALQLSHNYIGTEHMLLGLVREGEGVGAQVLASAVGDLGRVRQEVMQLLSGRAPDVEGSMSAGAASRPLGDPPRCPHCYTSLAGAVRYRMLDVESAGHEPDAPTLSVAIMYCERCGAALGTADPLGGRPSGTQGGA